MQYKFDVCFSFAGEQRDYVEQVYQELKKNNIRVFYDRDEDIETLLWGTNLIEVFKNVYRDKSKYCIMFLSKEYAEKTWTRHERRSALSRAISTYETYILPIRFDDTDIPGLDDSIEYLNASDKTPVQIAQIIIKKLGYISTNIVQTPQEAIHELATLLLDKIKKSNSQFTLIELENSIKIYKNTTDEKEEAYGAFIYCTKAGSEPEYKLININMFPKTQECLKLYNILQLMDEALENEYY